MRRKDVTRKQLIWFIPFMYDTSASASETITYGYDAQGRLIAEAHSGTVNNNAQVAFTLDNVNNRTNVTVTNAASRVIVVPVNGLTVIPIPDP